MDNCITGLRLISITDITGRAIKRIPLTLKEGVNEVQYDHGYNMTGIYLYTLIVDDKPIASKKMIFNR